MMLMSFRYEPYLLPEGFSPTEYDAICGWARQNFGHSGNRRLRDIISQNVPVYKSAKTKSDKGKVIVDLCKQLIMASPTRTGFVKLDSKSGRWYFIGYEKSKDKIGHALRKAAQFQAKKNKKTSSEAARRSPQTDSAQPTPRRLPQHLSPQGYPTSPVASPMTGESSREDSSSEEDRGRSSSIHSDTRQPILSTTPATSPRKMSGDPSMEPSPIPSPRSLLKRRTRTSDGTTSKSDAQVLRFLIGGPGSSDGTLTAPPSDAAAAAAARASEHQQQQQEGGNSDGSSGGDQSKGSSKASSLLGKVSLGHSPLLESPVRRSMFDSPLKGFPIPVSQASAGMQPSVSIPLPLSGGDYHERQEGREDDERVAGLIPPRDSSGSASPHPSMYASHPPPPPQGSHGVPSGYPPSYYYPSPYLPPPPSGYIYYPVPVHYPHNNGGYPPPPQASHYSYYPPQPNDQGPPPQRMPPSALRTNPTYASRQHPKDGDEGGELKHGSPHGTNNVSGNHMSSSSS